MKVTRNPDRRIILFLLFAAVSFRIFAADITIPTMEIITRADFSDTTPVIKSRGKVDMNISGGYKLGGNLTLGFDSSDLSYSDSTAAENDDSVSELAEYLDNQTFLNFQSASIVMRGVITESSSLTYFIGETDTFCSGDDFPRIFGTYPIATRYRGYLYFPNYEFDGIYKVNGTGLKMETNWGGDTYLSSVYIYQDGYLPDGYFSSDFRTLFNFTDLKMETFMGATFPAGDEGLYRAGFLMNYKSGDVGEFMAQVGVPLWDPNASFDADRLFFLFEPRIHFNFFSIILTLFKEPGYYLQEQMPTTGTTNVHLNFMLGDLTKSPLSGGIESSAVFDTSDTAEDQFTYVLTPYISAITSGVIWNIMVNINLFPFSLDDMFEGVIGIKAEF